MVATPALPTEIQTKNAEALPQSQDCSQHKHHSTIGKKAHWVATYLGGDWLLNSSFGVAFAYIMSRTHLGQKYYTQPLTKGFSSFVGLFTKNENTVARVVGGGFSFLNIMFGGTVVNPILTRLEKHENKLAIVKKVDEIVYGKDRVANDPQIKQAHEEIKHEAPKDTKSAWVARAFALIPLFTAAAYPQINKFFKSNKVPILSIISHDNISNFTRKTAERIGIRPKNMMRASGIDSVTGEVTSNWKALHDLIGFDFGYTVYYALIHSAAFNVAANLFENNREKRAIRKAAKEEVVMAKATPALAEEIATQTTQKASPTPPEKPESQVNHVAEHVRPLALEHTQQL